MELKTLLQKMRLCLFTACQARSGQLKAASLS
ncbi:hypothetical protein SAMN05444352_10955 [Pseudomonas japonica]|uniref:Uncharacterized protein n=1 Tax=Pseudomonas japonica TaxID=256466 RepID=A0A239F231_9PSED|nr:hypothetical protein SAMN05444352_10955 [Pseudomonas japonica]